MKKLFIEMADTPIKRAYGLKDRRHLSNNSGMLFKFPYEDRLSFWMQDTYIPLDIAFVDDGGKILQIEEMSPLSTRAIQSIYRCKYALEVNKGWFKKNDVRVGQTIGGVGFAKKKVMAQTVGGDVLEGPSEVMDLDEEPLDGEGDMGMPDMQAPPEPQQPSPDVMLNQSHKEIFEDANQKNQDLIVIYQTKEGTTLPPKFVSPPYNFLPDENGKSSSIVNLWDNQTSGWKSFLLDNILDVQEKVNYAEENVEGNMY